MTVAAEAPTSEKGQSTSFSNQGSWDALIGEGLEHVPKLMWPNSVTAFRRMLNDPQLWGLYLGLTMPIRSFHWKINPNGARPEVVQKLQEDLQLDQTDQEPQPRGRMQRRFSFHKHLEDALRAIVYGHYFFEQVGEIDKRGDGLWHLRKLAARPPYTLNEIKADLDGGLKYIRQQTGPTDPPIPVGVLVAYVWDREGANWTGRSMFRSSYGPWLIKDRVLRVGAINIERAGGVPYVEAPPGADADSIKALDLLAQNFKVGEASGGALPHGAILKLAQAGGGSDAVNYINLMNEEMARSFLLMVMQLGTTATGSRALGGTFADFAALIQSAVADWFADIFNEHVIEDWVEWNYGPTEQFAPLVYYEAGATDPMGAFDQQVDEGQIQVQPGGDVAAMLGRTTSRSRAGRQRRPVAAAEVASPVSLPDRPLRRQPYDHEVSAAVDFAQMDTGWQTERDSLVTAYRNAQRAQIDELGAAVIDAGDDMAALAEIQVAPVGEALISERMTTMAATGAAQVRAEAKAQGRIIKYPELDEVNAALASRASAVSSVLTRDITAAAARKALSLTGGTLTPADVAKQVVDHLRGLSAAYLEQQLGGALTAAQNAGRKAAMRETPPQQIYGSEILDTNTCENCTAIDGTQYETMSDAELDYPTGGYSDCLGGPQCRGTLVAVYGEAT